jgi:replication fork protection complex subunit Tof1/Swi1
MPGELDRSLRLLNNYLLDPIDLGGKKATDRISKAKLKKAKEKSNRERRQRTGTAPGPLRDSDPPDSDEELNPEEGWLSDPEKLLEKAKKTSNRKEKRKREMQEFLSAQFIEGLLILAYIQLSILTLEFTDSDAELGNDDEFFAREAAIKKRMAGEAAKVYSMHGHETKKRKKRQTVGADEDEQDEGAARRKRPRTSSPSMVSMLSIGSDDERPVADVSTPETSPLSFSGKGSPPPLSSRAASSALGDEMVFEDASPVERKRLLRKESQEDMDLSEEEALTTTRRRPARRVVNLSDEEDE